tara:strand:- start:389 stop:571 length:183 start_codon:yes stop_codon:yes gene_type:complete
VGGGSVGWGRRWSAAVEVRDGPEDDVVLVGGFGEDEVAEPGYAVVVEKWLVVFLIRFENS